MIKKGEERLFAQKRTKAFGNQGPGNEPPDIRGGGGRGGKKKRIGRLTFRGASQAEGGKKAGPVLPRKRKSAVRDH